MRQLNVTFEDDEHRLLTDRKDGRSWREAILEEFDVLDELEGDNE